jgi:hypothetical protein
VPGKGCESAAGANRAGLARKTRAVALSALLGFLALGAAGFGRTAISGEGMAVAAQGHASEKATDPADPTSGIEGTILISPVCPVERNPPLPECAPRPYQATITVKTADGAREVTQFTSDKDGHFSVALDPGKYLLAPSNGDPYPRAPSQVVRVEPHKFTPVTINYDSGMR